MQVDLAGLSRAHGVVHVAVVGAEVLGAGLEGEDGDEAGVVDLGVDEALVAAEPGEGHVLGVGRGLAGQEDGAVVLALLDVAFRFVCTEERQKVGRKKVAKGAEKIDKELLLRRCF